MEADAYIVVDVLRATTTLAVLFDRGVTDVVAVDDIDRARTLAAAEDRVLLGEVGGTAPEGFAYGNSPVELRDADLAGRGAVLFTSNGTPALCALAHRAPTVTGSLANLSAAAGHVARHERPVVVCAGGDGGRRFAIEDFATAGAIVQVALRLAPGSQPGDAAGMALDWMGWEEWIASGIDRYGRPGHLVGRSRHARYLRSIGLGADVEFAAREDGSSALPAVVHAEPGLVRLRDASRG
jgi:2-phosphosulfolactate phosphatase